MIPWNFLLRSLGRAAREPARAARMLGFRGRSLFHYHVDPGSAPPPETVSLHLRYGCNLRCRACHQWGGEGVYKHLTDDGTLGSGAGAELPLHEIETLVAELAPHRTSFTLFGGEPTLYPDLLEVIAAIAAHRLFVNLITNGTRLVELAPDLVRSGLSEVVVSLDGPRAENDRIRGPGAHDRAVAGIRALLSARGSARTPRVRIACTILPENQNALRALAALGASLRVDAVAFHHTIAIDRSSYERLLAAYRELEAVPSDWSGFLAALGPGPGPSTIDPVRLACTLREMTRSAPARTPIEILPPLDPGEYPRYYNLTRDFLPDSHPNRCLSPWMTAYVFPNGAIRPCPYSNYDLGRLGTRPFLELWNGARAADYREFLRRRATFPACGRCTELYRA